jgi:deoxyribonuclease V
VSRGPLLHRWDLSVREAITLQADIAHAVERNDRLGDVRTIAGIDVAYGRRGRSVDARAAAVLFDATTLEVLERAAIQMAITFPYVPGLLTFREAPPAIAALQALSRRPDLLLCDGQGLAHPRRCGFASHLGLALDLPSIGVAKSRLIGTHDEAGPERGAWTPLLDDGEVIGACLRTQRRVRLVYVSIGNRVSLQTAIEFVLRTSTRYRLPEPTRLADKLSKARSITAKPQMAE